MICVRLATRGSYQLWRRNAQECGNRLLQGRVLSRVLILCRRGLV
jgi:hypothetical protein